MDAFFETLWLGFDEAAKQAAKDGQIFSNVVALKRHNNSKKLAFPILKFSKSEPF